MKKVIANLLIGLLAIGVLVAVVILSYIVGDITVTEVGVKLLASVGIAIGKFVLGLCLLFFVIGIVINIIGWLTADATKEGN